MSDKEFPWARLQQFYGYSDEQMEEFKRDPKKVKVAIKSKELRRCRIIAEVIHSHGCSCGHKVGDKFVLSAASTLETRECPEHVCIFALSNLDCFVAMIQDRIVEGLDPNGIIWDHASCWDAGFSCGGWGRIAMKIHAEQA